MAVLNAGVLVGADDGEWFTGAWDNNNVNMLVGKQAGLVASFLFIRFDNLTMDASTINSAFLSVRAAGNDSDGTLIRIYGELAADPAAVTSIADGNARTRTTAFVDWTPGTVVGGTYYNTPDLSTIIQELVDASYVYSGTQAMQFFFQDNGSPANTSRSFRTYDHSSTLSEPQLTIDYTPSNDPPTIVPNTADATVFNSDTPTLEFTGSDADSNDLTYEIEISDSVNFEATGEHITASHTPVTIGIIHPNPDPVATTWQGVPQVDDRPGTSYETTANGLLSKVQVKFNPDTDTDGYAVIRIYEATGTYGSDDNEPLNAAIPSLTPTPGWLAESDQFPFTTATPGSTWRDFTFSGANQIRLEAGTTYMLILDWIPVNRIYTNTLTFNINTGLTYTGNMYIDGNSVPNNGIYLGGDTVFQLYQLITTLAKASDTNAGFLNTVNGADTDPFTAGQMISYTIQAGEEIDPYVTYYWRVRCSDPAGSGLWSAWTTTRTFTYVPGDTTPTIVADTPNLTTFGTLTPSLEFTGTDVEAGDLTYEIEVYEGLTLIESAASDTDAGFENVDTPLDTDPFNSGDMIAYTVQAPLTNGTTYNWRARVSDPGGSGLWSSWTANRLFDIDFTPPTIVQNTADLVTFSTLIPTVLFTGSDVGGDNLTYQIQIRQGVVDVIDALSTSDIGFINQADGGDFDPFTEGDMIGFSVQPVDALTNGLTYTWRVRTIDLTGTNTWSSWTAYRTFDIDVPPGASTAVVSKLTISISMGL